MRRCFIYIIIAGLSCWLGIAVALAQPNTRVSISGFVKDSLTGESLQGASVALQPSGRGVSSNAYGFYSITTDKGSVELVATYVGYAPKRILLAADSSQQMDILLVPASYYNTAVTVLGRRKENAVQSAQMGKVELSMDRIKQVPAFLGEVDVLKALQLLPGVRNAGEGNAGLYVRGGGPTKT